MNSFRRALIYHNATYKAIYGIRNKLVFVPKGTRPLTKGRVYETIGIQKAIVKTRQGELLDKRLIAYLAN